MESLFFFHVSLNTWVHGSMTRITSLGDDTVNTNMIRTVGSRLREVAGSRSLKDAGLLSQHVSTDEAVKCVHSSQHYLPRDGGHPRMWSQEVRWQRCVTMRNDSATLPQDAMYVVAYAWMWAWPDEPLTQHSRRHPPQNGCTGKNNSMVYWIVV